MRTVPPGILALAVSLAPVSALAQPVRAVAVLPPGQASDTAGYESYTDTTQTMSADGRYVVFRSRAGNLVQGQVPKASSDYYESVFVRDRATGVTSLVSHISGSLVSTANGSSFSGMISADGGFVAFGSWALDIVPGTHPRDNVFVYVRGNGQVTLVSHAFGLPGTDGNGDSRVQGISADGRYVVFLSFAGDLVGNGPVASQRQAYVYDRLTGTNTLLSHLPGSPTTPGTGGCGQTVISSDGSFVGFTSAAPDLVSGIDSNGAGVAFESKASDIVPGIDANMDRDVFLFDAGTGSVRLVSHVPGSTSTAGSAASYDPRLDGGGELLAFASDATDLVPGFSGGNRNIFVYSGSTAGVALASHPPDSAQTGADGDLPAIASDGSLVGFASYGTLVAGTDTNYARDVFGYSPSTGSNELISRRAPGMPQRTASSFTAGYNLSKVSSDGRFVVFRSGSPYLLPGVENPTGLPFWGLYLFDAATEVVRLVSHAPGSPLAPGCLVPYGPEPPDDAVVSGDGSTVAFTCEVLISPSRGSFQQAFLYDRDTQGLILVSHSTAGPDVPGFGSSGGTSVSLDGSRVAFGSIATDLTNGTYPPFGSASQVFLYDRGDGLVRLVSHVVGQPEQPPSGSLSYLGVVSGDGSHVAYLSEADGLVAGVSNPQHFRNVYLYEVASATNTLVSHAAGSPNTPTEGYPGSLGFSDDGRFVSFSSVASNLVVGQVDDSFSEDAFVYDASSGSLSLASHLPLLPTSAGGGSGSVLSADGGAVAFGCQENLVGGPPSGPFNVCFYDVPPGSSPWPATPSAPPQQAPTTEAASPC